MGISSPGIGSNLDIDGIISKLMQVEAKPLTTLAKKEASYQSKLSAFGSLSGALSAFQSTLSNLSDLSRFQQLNASTTDATVVSAAASNLAVPGKYEINLTQHAQAQSLSTAGQATTSVAIGAGTLTTLTFSFGTIGNGTLSNGLYSGATFTPDPEQSIGTVKIDSSNNSLQGIRDAINKAAIGVTATIVSDGSASPNRLVLSSNKTGAASSLNIAVAGETDLQNLLAYDASGTQNLTQNTVGQNALVNINGIDVQSANNTLTGAVEGLTFTLGKIGTTSVTVARDVATVESNVNALVKSYNDLTSTIKALTAYNTETKTGGPLIGDSTVRTVQAELRRMFSIKPEGLTGSLTNLSQIGLAFQKDGTLALDSAKLKTAINDKFSEVGKLFAVAGTPTDKLVSFAGATAATKAGSHILTITALATKGQLAGASAAVTTITADINDSLNLTIDGVDASITLPAGVYTSDTLTTQLQSLINGTSKFSDAGITVTVSQSAGILTVTSNRFGSASKVAIEGLGADSLLGAGRTAVAGDDIAGSIDGLAAVGSGQFLTGATGSGAEGLRLQISTGVLGARGSIDFSQGYAAQFKNLIGTFISSNGLISGRTDGINRSIKDVGNQRTVLNERLAGVEERYRKQFTALDVMISNMSSTSAYLTQQLDALANLNN